MKHLYLVAFVTACAPVAAPIQPDVYVGGGKGATVAPVPPVVPAVERCTDGEPAPVWGCRDDKGDAPDAPQQDRPASKPDPEPPTPEPKPEPPRITY